jgi:hypothetical protein
MGIMTPYSLIAKGAKKRKEQRGKRDTDFIEMHRLSLDVPLLALCNFDRTRIGQDWADKVDPLYPPNPAQSVFHSKS